MQQHLLQGMFTLAYDQTLDMQHVLRASPCKSSVGKAILQSRTGLKHQETCMGQRLPVHIPPSSLAVACGIPASQSLDMSLQPHADDTYALKCCLGS